MQWYFFTWEAIENGKRGTQILPFNSEFDLEKAHEFLLAGHGIPAMVTFVMAISAENAAGFKRFVSKDCAPEKISGLRLVKGDGQ